jgi:hypothetical protein
MFGVEKRFKVRKKKSGSVIRIRNKYLRIRNTAFTYYFILF